MFLERTEVMQLVREAAKYIKSSIPGLFTVDQEQNEW